MNESVASGRVFEIILYTIVSKDSVGTAVSELLTRTHEEKTSQSHARHARDA